MSTKRNPSLRSLVANTLGLSLVAATLALSLPGVHAVRADEPDMTPVGSDDYAGLVPMPPAALAPAVEQPSAEACADPAAQRADATARQRLLAGVAGKSPDQPGVVLLNNRGYNYGASEGPAGPPGLRVDREMLASPE